MAPANFFHSLISLLKSSLLEAPEDALWTSILLWTVRITTLSLLFRAYFGPWILSLMSNHIRVRSISIWSIRGLYIHKGDRTCHVERISYEWFRVGGSRRLAIKVYGLNLEFSANSSKSHTIIPVSRRHNRSLTLADFAPSPMAYRLWQLFSSLYSVVEPIFRPLIRSIVVSGLRIIIRWLPGITQALTFDFHSTTISLLDVPGSKVSIEKIHLHSALAFTHLGKVTGSVNKEKSPRVPKSRRLYGMSAWKTRLTDSFQRTLDRAWGKARGSATIGISFVNVMGIVSDGQGGVIKVIDLPGIIDAESSMRFHPGKGTIDSHSVEAKLTMRECFINARAFFSLLDDLKTPISTQPMFNHSDNLSKESVTSEADDLHINTSKMSHLTSGTSIQSSPFLDVIPASMRPRRQYVQPCTKLKSHRNTALLSILNCISIHIDTISMSSQLGDNSNSYNAIIQDVGFKASASDPDLNLLHRQWLGRHVEGDDLTDAFSLGFSIQHIMVERSSRQKTSRILALGTLNVDTLLSHWPTPWLRPSPFLQGDPNAPLLVLHVQLEGIKVSEEMDHIHELSKSIMATMRSKHTSDKQAARSGSRSVPRCVVDVQCGPICGRFICDTPVGLEPLAIELRTDGFIISGVSSFSHDSFSGQRSTSTSLDSFLLRMDIKFTAMLKPTFMRVRSAWPISDTYKFSSLALDGAFLDDPALLSMEALEVIGECKALATFRDDVDGIAVVDLSSRVADFHVSSDAICIEMWHSRVIAAVHQIIQLKFNDTASPISSPVSSQSSAGLSATLALGRAVVFVSAPDINPEDKMELSRGLALRTGISIQYCSMHSGHIHGFKNLSQKSQTRHKLYLPEEKVMAAVAAAKVSTVTQSSSAFIGISIMDFVLRSAVATQYVADDPMIAERDDPAFKRQEFIRIASIRLDACFASNSSTSSKIVPSCEISLKIPYIWAKYQLVHVYSALLAIQTLKSSSTARHHHPVQTSSPGVVYRFHGNITTIQILGILPKQKLVTRFDSINMNLMSGMPVSVRWDKAVVWVSLPSQVNKWDRNMGEKWAEFISLQVWTMSFSHSSILTVSVKGDSARLQIPFGYIFADLITDAIITSKALRHLFQITVAGRYTPMPMPDAESPKLMPNLTFRIGCLCLEASDDSFESNLGVIWRMGSGAVKQQIDREAAFNVKVAAIIAAESGSSPEHDADYQFSANHSVSIDEARQRLDEVHALDWSLRYEASKENRTRSENFILRKLHRSSPLGSANKQIPNLVYISQVEQVPPLFRTIMNDLSLTVKPPSFPIHDLPDFLYSQGDGLPRDTQFSILVPMHINFTLSSLRITFRDYPLPLMNVTSTEHSHASALEFDTDIVFGEEMGTDFSVEWYDCPVVESHIDLHGAAPFSLSIPRTIMPVKSYANPVIQVTTNSTTAFSWGVSYSAATQDLMRIIETLTSAPRDSSPVTGFWDKMRLVFHWTVRAAFRGEVCLVMKGSRDPYDVYDTGAGFVFSWQGNPQLLIGCNNEDRELVQIISDTMLIAIPNLQYHIANAHTSPPPHSPDTIEPYRKVCAKFQSGIRFGVGFVLERSCGMECSDCSGSASQRKCRYFSFRPHYSVKLEKKLVVPVIKGLDDSYNGFRSDFVHLSLSLASSRKKSKLDVRHNPSSLHLTPKAFAHFWSWWALFDGVLSLPVRHGSYYPHRPPTPKLGRHLATIKYRILVPHLFVMHAYMNESRETWADGVTPWIGVKAMIDDFQADLHQRDQEAVVPGLAPNTTKVLRRKPFYAAEVVLKGLDLRAMLATFTEPLKKSVPVASSPLKNNFWTRSDLLSTHISSMWYDPDDFFETDWSSSDTPTLHFLPVASCPHFTYFKRNSAKLDKEVETNKFGVEQSHTCLLGQEPSIPQIQVSLTKSRIQELKRALSHQRPVEDGDVHSGSDQQSLEKMISLLEDYVAVLQGPYATTSENAQSYHMPFDTVSPDEWAEFDHVYQIHCPRLSMDSAVRDIMMRYYYCSRARKGLEYHMATRAVKFIRDQAEASFKSKTQNTTGGDDTSQTAIGILHKILKDESPEPPEEGPVEECSSSNDGVNPLNGWCSGVSIRKSHCCLLLKPQVVLHGEGSESLIVAAVQAKLQSFAIMDNANIDDPISGKVMTRSYTSLSGLQTFAPTQRKASDDGCLPLEVLIDLRCESNNFDRLVPQTDAILHYDKFNRLRLRNSITSIAVREPTDKVIPTNNEHLRDQTDLIEVHIPRFTVTANDEHFQAISNIVAKLLLFSDLAHKTRLDTLETLLITYDFTDLTSAANVVADLQGRLRSAIETERAAQNIPRQADDDMKLDLLKLKAHIFLLVEELNFLFDAIKLAQDRFDDQTDKKSALLLHASSSEIAWNMLDEGRDLLSKLAVQEIDFYWLSRQDSSTVTDLAVGNLQAFDGSRHAVWPEILSKYNEPANHPLLKRGLFLLANWTILAPVGGITIYESFDLRLHPLRLQIDAKVGRKIMEYLWPARRHRQSLSETEDPVEAKIIHQTSHPQSRAVVPSRSSLDSPRTLQGSRMPESTRAGLTPPLRRLGTSRSFTDLRAMSGLLQTPLQRTQSSEALRHFSDTQDVVEHQRMIFKNELIAKGANTAAAGKAAGDAAEMKTRASQKSFVLVRIPSLDVLLSILKEGSFECHDARIKTRDLEYRNQTWSFEELVNQFIPSNLSWRGWMKMAFHQPLVPVLPVARELLAKTKWIASSRGVQLDAEEGTVQKAAEEEWRGSPGTSRRPTFHRGWQKTTHRKAETPPISFTSTQLTSEPASFKHDEINRPKSRNRMLSLFTSPRSKKETSTPASPIYVRHSEESGSP